MLYAIQVTLFFPFFAVSRQATFSDRSQPRLASRYFSFRRKWKEFTTRSAAFPRGRPRSGTMGFPISDVLTDESIVSEFTCKICCNLVEYGHAAYTLSLIHI